MRYYMRYYVRFIVILSIIFAIFGCSNVGYKQVENTGATFGRTITWDAINRLSGTWVNNSNGNPNISDTILAVNSEVTEATWESIGPTGSGADNIWTAMDSIPTGVDWIKIYARSYGSDGSASSNLFIYTYIRETGGAQGIGSDNMILHAYGLADGFGDDNLADSSEVTVPVDSSIRFDVYWTGDCTSENIVFRIVGWGYNP